jgi:DNA-binding transcriptional LysR family regulator
MEDRLVKFARIVEAGSFTKAAAVLHISQPALTTAVKKLERELQAELLIRGGHTLRLTAAGTAAYQTAQLLITETQNLEAAVRQVAGQKIALNLGMIDSLATLLFVHKSYFSELEQGAQVSLVIDNSSRLIELTSHNELDMALVVEPQNLPASLLAARVAEEPLVLVASTVHAAAICAELASGQLRQFMSYNRGSRTYQIIAEHLARHQVTLRPAFYSTSPEIMLQLVLAERSAAVLPYLLIQPYLEQGSVQAIPIDGSPLIRRTIISLRRPGRHLSNQTKLLLAHATNELRVLDKQASRL